VSFKYEGSELDLFRGALNWKFYWASMVMPHLKGRVLEVGAGIGANTEVLIRRSRYTEWVALEPDIEMCNRMNQLPSLVSGGRPDQKIKIVHGDVAKLLLEPTRYDCVLYIDVLEHIRDDRREIDGVANLLSPEGLLIILSPAYEWLYSPFDKAIGHIRRYNHKSLRKAVSATEFSQVMIRHLDSSGILLSAANRFITRKASPKPADIQLWDRVFVPISRVVDPLLGYSVGKSILGIWRRR
jgi:spermidine synthase